MTSRDRGVGLIWLVAPVAAGTFALSTQWTLHHDPMQPADPAGTSHAGADQGAAARTSALQRDVRLAARRLARTQATVLRLESSVQGRSARADRIESTLRTAGQGAAAGPSATQLGGSSAPASAPLPPVQVPPSTHTTTGAS